MDNYSVKEERLNVNSHAFGIFMSIIFIILLMIKSYKIENIWWISFTYGLSQLILFSSSTLYHNSKIAKYRKKLKIMDHSAIYISIAGTYTPFALISIKGETGFFIFGLIWISAIIGIILKVFLTGKLTIISTFIYLLMGWLIIFYWSDLIQNLSNSGIYWLITGGIVYTIGAIFFSIEKIPLNHFIFHILVIIGSLCHFISIYLYVI